MVWIQLESKNYSSRSIPVWFQTHLKNRVVKLDHLSQFQCENQKNIQRNTVYETF